MPRYFFAGCELDTDRHTLRVAGIVRHVEPQVFDLLRLLVTRRKNLVTRDHLIEHVWAGRIVSDSAISVRINTARRTIGDDGKRQSIIRTVPRRGFRLAVDVYREDNGPNPGSESRDDRPAIAVFAFDSPTGDDTNYLVRGIADDIATELSRFQAIVVISTFSTFQHDTRRGSARAFAASLGATHIVTGSFRTHDRRIRLTIRLGLVASSRIIWSERYDIDTAEILDARDEAVRAIVGSLVSRLHEQQLAAAA